MARKYLAFDIETAKEIPGQDFNWKPQRPLGICCAAALPQDAQTPIVWHGLLEDGKPAPRLSRDEARRVVDELERFVSQGYTLLTWNGLGFDLNILAEESGAHDSCRALAASHVDMMFHVFCDRGFPVGLDRAAAAMKIPGKPAGMSGILAPQLWAKGKCQDVIAYVSQDVRIAMQIAIKCEQMRRFDWLTQRGQTKSISLPRGWLAVDEAMRLPQPDTSWMDRPLPRSEFTSWMRQSPPARKK